MCIVVFCDLHSGLVVLTLSLVGVMGGTTMIMKWKKLSIEMTTMRIIFSRCALSVREPTRKRMTTEAKSRAVLSIPTRDADMPSCLAITVANGITPTAAPK
uniref:Putative secreted protein n=1 Tax=Ixodes ricinus TaxID=34613 RepID=A0A6B0UF05_IXORI